MGNQNHEIAWDPLQKTNNALEYFPAWEDPGPGIVLPHKLEEDELVI